MPGKPDRKSGDKSPHSKLFGLFPRVIRRPGERARLDMFESHLKSNVAPAIEFRGSDVALDGQTSWLRLQVLADRHDVAGDGVQVLHQLNHFVEGFAQAYHDAAL